MDETGFPRDTSPEEDAFEECESDGYDTDTDLAEHFKFLQRGFKDIASPSRKTNTRNEALLMSPLFSHTAQTAISAMASLNIQNLAIMGSEAILPSEGGTGPVGTKLDPIYLNTSTPSSAFICGLQGSGKSHTLACMLECFLLDDSLLKPSPKPLAGLVFHYDAHTGGICEAAGICSGGVKTRVLASPSNVRKLKHLYGKLEGASKNLEVIPLRLQSQHLNVERITKLMGFSNENPPLYQLVRHFNVGRASKALTFCRLSSRSSATWHWNRSDRKRNTPATFSTTKGSNN